VGGVQCACSGVADHLRCGALKVPGLGSTTGGSMSTGSGAGSRAGSLPPYLRRSPKIAEVLLMRHLPGLSTRDLRPALETLLGEDAVGFCRRRTSGG